MLIRNGCLKIHIRVAKSDHKNDDYSLFKIIYKIYLFYIKNFTPDTNTLCVESFDIFLIDVFS